MQNPCILHLGSRITNHKSQLRIEILSTSFNASTFNLISGSGTNQKPETRRRFIPHPQHNFDLDRTSTSIERVPQSLDALTNTSVQCQSRNLLIWNEIWAQAQPNNATSYVRSRLLLEVFAVNSYFKDSTREAFCSSCSIRCQTIRLPSVFYFQF